MSRTDGGFKLFGEQDRQRDRIAEQDALIKELVGRLQIVVEKCDVCDGEGTMPPTDWGPEYPCAYCLDDRTLIAKATKESG